MPPPSPEQRARAEIDAHLTASDWLVQDYRAVDLSASRGIALREVPLLEGRCDYLLLVDRVPVSVVEAKKAGTTLSEAHQLFGDPLPKLLEKMTETLAA